MKNLKFWLTIVVILPLMALNAQVEDELGNGSEDPFGDFGDDGFGADEIDSNKNSYSIDFQLNPTEFVLISDDKEKFTKQFAQRFNVDLEIEKLIKNINERKINTPNYESIGTPLSVSFSTIRQTLQKELKEFENGLWQDIAKMPLLDDNYEPLSISKFQKSYLWDSLNPYYELIPGMDPDDPANYTQKIEKLCSIYPFQSVLKVHNEQLYFGLKFPHELSTIYIRINDLSENLYYTKKLLSNKFFKNKLIKEINESATSWRLSDLITDDAYFESQLLDTISANKYNWIYTTKRLDEKNIIESNMQRMDYVEFAFNRFYLLEEYVLIDDEADPDDPASYQKILVPRMGEFLIIDVSPGNWGEMDSTFLSLIVESKINKTKRTDKLVGLLFNAKNAVFFEDYQGEISEEMYEYFWLLYELSNT